MMKKFCLLMILLCTPLSSMAMTAMDDEDLGAMYGQSGVSIMVDITMDIHFDVLAWGDSDGLGSNNIWNLKTSGGYVGATGVTISGLTLASRLYAVSPNSVSFMPDSGTIDVVNGVPYYRVNAGLNQ